MKPIIYGVDILPKTMISWYFYFRQLWSSSPDVEGGPECKTTVKIGGLTKGQFRECVNTKVAAVLVKAQKTDLILKQITANCITNVVDAVYCPKRQHGGVTLRTYHKDQKVLLDDFKSRGLIRPNFSVDDKGNIQDMSDKNRLTAEKFCDLLDGISIRYLKKLQRLHLPIAQGATTNRKERVKLQIVTETCKRILVGRVLADKANKNDIMRDDGYSCWKRHIWVISSFSALLVILEMWHLKLGGTFFNH